ncbi:uncharacterized protein LOC116136587 [Pistacia vera]|uniref:uncharacterized protein LOC116136587 n=1 Tax=Pistacia vera TaxID=55513 RepID=UPI001263E5A6|nr:uncharacterized protein LOC116136587 [Pistacia vera]
MSVSEFFKKLKGIAEILSGSGQVISDEDLLQYELDDLGPKFDVVVVNLTSRIESKFDSVSPQEAQFLLQKYEMRLEKFNSIDFANSSVHMVSLNNPYVTPLPSTGLRGSLSSNDYHVDGSLHKYKARLVAKGFQQTLGLDYFETFSQVVKPSTIRIIFTLTVSKGWDIQQVDVNNVFLNGILSEIVYMSQPIGFEHPQLSSHVCKLDKALYGLKHASRAWFDKLKQALLNREFQNLVSDSNLFILKDTTQVLYILIYADDILITRSDNASILQLVVNLNNEFSLKTLGSINNFLGLEATRNAEGIHLKQTKYIGDLLSKTKMQDTHVCPNLKATGTELFSSYSELFKDPSLYRSIIEALQYLTLIRPDISFTMNKPSQFLQAPTKLQWQACKRVLLYIKGTQFHELQFKPTATFYVECYTNADWGGNLNDRRSTRKNSFIWLGPTPSINITDPKLIREIMSRYEIFQKPKMSPLGKLVFNGMVMYEDEQWFRVRKTANPAFHLEKLKNMLPKIYLSCNEMIRQWKSSIANEESCELDVWPDIKTLTADVISQTAFGSSFEDGRKIFELITEQISLLNPVFYFFHIPGWRFLPTQANRKLKSNNIEIIELIKGIINKREEALKVGEAGSDDLLGLLVESNHREIQEHGNKETGMSIEEVIEECKLFYLAGQETTASLIVWTMILLCMHQTWQERAREEVFQVFGSKEPQFDELNRLKEVNKILHEALRLYPPVALFIRATMKEFKLGEMKIPPGVLIALPMILVHQDEQYWGADAKDFNPDRFSQGVSKASKNDQVSFFPFGWGPRICIGQNFALLEAKLALTMIVQNFSFQLSPTYVHAPARGVAIQPQHGAHMILRKI